MKTDPLTIPTMTVKDFSMDRLDVSGPVLITDGLAGWPALSRWTPETLLSLTSKQVIDLSMSKSGRWRYTPAGDAFNPEAQHRIADVPIAEAVRKITDKSESAKYYVSQLTVAKELPELLADLRFPLPIESTQINLWFGSSGTVSPLHFDRTHNLFAQIYGDKKFTLFAPDDTTYLYPYPADAVFPHLSAIDLEEPDLDAYPLYQQAKPLIFTIHAGQLLFMPAFWWHHVRSESVSISVNQWWYAELRDFNGANALRLLRTEYQKDRWARIRGTFQPAGRSLLESAEAVLPVSLELAVLAGAAAMHEAGSGYEADERPEDPVLGSQWQSLVQPVLEGRTDGLDADDVSSFLQRIRLALETAAALKTS